MFTADVVRQGVEDAAGIPHNVRIITPISFVLRPDGLPRDRPGYQVLVERAALQLHAQVQLDPLARAVRSAVLEGHHNNPDGLEKLREAIVSESWRPDLRIDDETLVLAAHGEVGHSPVDDEAVGRATKVAGLLSAFVLQHLVVTRRFETRPASRRATDAFDEPHDIWEYDPSERDKATLQHRLLENWLMEKLAEHGLEPVDAIRGPAFDLGWQSASAFVVCEVKSTTGAEDHQLRLGIGQVLQYREQMRDLYLGACVAALLVSSEPADPIWKRVCETLGIILFWPEDEELPSDLLAMPLPESAG